MGLALGGNDRARGAIVGGASGVVVAGIVMAIAYGGNGAEGYAAHWRAISLCVLSAGGAGVFLGLISGLRRTGDAGRRSSGLATLLVLVAAFCGYGFLASFEPGPYLAFRVGYPVVGALCLVAAGWLQRKA